jgi:hypothetical protein
MLKTALLACASFFLFGCSTHLPEPNATVNVEAITFALLTELYCASDQLPANDGTPYFGSSNNWVGLIDLNLSASVEASANPSVSLLGPFNPSRAVAPNGGTTGTFTSLFSSSIDETRTNLREYKMYIKMPALIQNWRQFAADHAWPVDCLHPNAGGTFLQGRLGLKGWLAPAVRVEQEAVNFQVLNLPAGPGVPTPPSISDIDPKNGPVNTPVHITGVNLPTKDFTVKFGSVAVPPADVEVPKNASGTLIIAKAPPPDANASPSVTVTVRTKAGTTATALSLFTYTRADELIKLLATSGTGTTSGSSQSPTISGTFTFQIKTTGTIGPSFALTRVSGGANNLFTATRTDNNYVNIALTPATYCPFASPECIPTITTAGVIPALDMQNATARLEAALLNLNLNHLVQQ